MTPEQWARIKDLFEAALAVERSARRTFLTDACGSDAVLLADLESLIAAHESDEPPSDTTSRAGGVAPGDDDMPGRRIDRYEIVRRIGVGGMGTVYLATRADAAYNQRVAIKVVNDRFRAAAILARFRHERQILATLDHPNITRLLDGGTTADGLPYLVMDFVDGIRIDEYCDRHRLVVKMRIALLLDVCAAVHYIHQHLVVHRDLKPGNILVTAAGVPKLLDFGIAKLLSPDIVGGQTDATHVGFRALTPRYASPEQVRGEAVTTASDVYALGVILYELLSGQRPYDLKSESPADVVRAVCEQEPVKPSVAVACSSMAGEGTQAEGSAASRNAVPAAVARQLQGELDAIVLKALRKEPQRRYSSVEALADDLWRYLHGLPVRAHADSWAYRTRKFVGRHRAAVAAAAIAIISVLAGAATTVWQARIARAEHLRAEQQFNDVRRLSTSLLFEFHDSIETLPGSTPARRLLVQRALEYLGKLASEAASDRRLQLDLAEAYLKIGDVQGNPYAANLGDTQGAAQSYYKALQISQPLVEGDRADGQAQRYVGRSHRSLGDVLSQLGRPAEAIASFRTAIAVFEKLSVANPEDADLREQLAGSYQELGDVEGHAGLQNVGDSASALESYHNSLSLYKELITSTSHRRAARRGMTLVQIRIGDMQEFRDNLNDSQEAYNEALKTSSLLSAEDPGNAEDRRRLALAHRKVGGIEEDLGQYREALTEYSQAAAINEGLMTADPTNVQAAMSYVISLRWAGDLLAIMGDRSGALGRYRRILEILQRLASTTPTNVTVQHRLAEMLIVAARLVAQNGDNDAARGMTARGLALSRELAKRPEVPPDDLSQYAVHFLTCEPAALREPATALRYAKASVEKAGETDSDDLDILAQAYFANGDRAHALEAEEKALSLLAPLEPGRAAPQARRHRLEAQLARFKSSHTKPSS